MTRSSYHHGNLRHALVEATVRLIEEKGPQAFTLAEAARLAGVSAAAPYRHFAGRDELLEEVARQGIEEFAERLEAALAELARARPAGVDEPRITPGRGQPGEPRQVLAARGEQHRGLGRVQRQPVRGPA